MPQEAAVNNPTSRGLASPRAAFILMMAVIAAFMGVSPLARADYTGSASTVSPDNNIQSAATEILGNGGGSGAFVYKGGGNAVDAAVAAALAACVINPGNASLGGYGGHMMIWKAGSDDQPQLATCIDFNSAAGSLASSNMFTGSINPTNGVWTGAQPPANEIGWKAVGVPGTFAGLYMAQTNYGRKVSGTNYFPFAEILKPALARVANGQVAGTVYYSLSSVSNLLMDLYTNSPGYLGTNGQPNPNSVNNPHKVFYSGDIATDIVAAMQAYGGLVTYADMTNYRPREVQPYKHHFNPPNGTPAWVFAAPPGSSGVSVLQELATLEALGWTNGPTGTWDSLHYWHSRAEIARLMWKEHFQWLGDPWKGILPPNVLGNGSTNFCDQLLAHATNSYTQSCPSDPTEILLTNSLAGSVIQAVNNNTTVPILVHWDDIRYGTRNISTSDKWGNCVAVTFSMGSGFGAQVGVTNRGLVFGQGMALFEPRSGWANSIAPGKRPVDNMCPIIVVPDFPTSPTNGLIGGRPPLAIGAVGGSTIENNMVMEVAKYLIEPPSGGVSDPDFWMYNFEANPIVYMRPSYPSGVAAYLPTVGLSAPGGPPSSGEVSYVQAWIPPTIVTQPSSTNVASGSTVSFKVTATGLPLFYQWFKNGVPLTDGGVISGAQTPRVTVTSVTSGGSYSVVVSNSAQSVASAPAGLTVNGAPAIVIPPVSRTNFAGTLATFSVSAMGTAPLAYQWTRNGAPLGNSGNVSGATTSSLSLSNVSFFDVAGYAVVITNGAGSATSAPAATLSIFITNPPSNLFLYEPFDYANIGGPVSDNTPANWTFGGSGANDLSVVGGNLSYPGLRGSIGNSVTNGGNGLGVRRLFGTNFSSGKIYFSALFRINDLGFGAWNGLSSALGALCATDNTSFRLQVLVKSNSPSGFVFGTQKSGTGATATFDTTERHAGDTFFLVGKYDFTATPNPISLWINPDAATFGAASAPSGFISATTGPDGLTIDRFNMRQNAATGSSSVPASIQWDELRFGFAWADVTPLLLSPPALDIPPQSQTVLAGQNVGFSVTASGSAPLAYQWRFKGSNLPGATTTFYNVGTARITNSGAYSVVVSNAYGIALSADATLSVMILGALGDNSWGQTSFPVSASNLVAIAAGAWHSVALGADGGIVAWGDNFSGQCDVPPALTNAVAIAAGGYHNLAINANGTVTAWGDNGYGQTTVPANLANVIAISAGMWHSLALRDNGTVTAWGDDTLGQTNVPPGLTDVVAVTAGGNHSLALKTNGTVVAWGDNTDSGGSFAGQSVVPAGLSNVVAIAAGDYHSLAVKSDGTIVLWGDNSQGQCNPPAGLTNVVAMAGGGGHSLALRSDGTVAAWGANWNGQCDLSPALTNVVGIAAGAEHTLLLAVDSMFVPRLFAPRLNGNRFSALLQTFNTRNYELEYKTSLTATTWISLPLVPGNGALRMLTDTSAAGPQRFYRVRLQ